MPIERKGEFLKWDDSGFNPALGIETNRLESCIKETQNENLAGLFGSPGWGFKQDNLDFLNRTPKVEGIHFWDIDLTSINGLYSLENLRYFLLDGKRPGIDFKRLPKLETVIWTYNTKDKNLETLQSIKNFYLWHFNPSAKSFRSLQAPGVVKKLEINWANPTSLEGLPGLPNLEEAEFHLCRNLRSLEGLEDIAPKLKRIVVTRCKRLENLKALDRLKHLKEVFVDHQQLTR